jgi:hypothetical protein
MIADGLTAADLLKVRVPESGETEPTVRMLHCSRSTSSEQYTLASWSVNLSP